MSHSVSFSPPAAARSRRLRDEFADLGLYWARAKVIANIEKNRRPDVVPIRQPIVPTPAAGSSRSLMPGNLSQVQQAGLIAAGLLAVALVANLIRG